MYPFTSGMLFPFHARGEVPMNARNEACQGLLRQGLLRSCVLLYSERREAMMKASPISALPEDDPRQTDPAGTGGVA